MKARGLRNRTRVTQTENLKADIPREVRGSMKIAFLSRLAVLCVCSVPLHGLAAETTTGTVVVHGARLGDLRKAMNKAQDRFLDLYNRVNNDVDQRLACADSAPTGSRLSKRSCSTRAQNRATEELARNYLSAAAGISANQAESAATREQASTNAQSGAPLSADESAALAGAQPADTNVDTKSGEAAAKVSQEAREFEENLQKLLDKNPELRERYEEFLAARQSYQEAGGKL